MAMYTARSMMGWSLEEFWRASPALLDGQMKSHLKVHRPRKKGRKAQRQEPTKVRYVDQLPGNFW